MNGEICKDLSMFTIFYSTTITMIVTKTGNNEKNNNNKNESPQVGTAWQNICN